MFVEYRCVCSHVSFYLLVHMDLAASGRCGGFPSAVEEKGAFKLEVKAAVVRGLAALRHTPIRSDRLMTG